MWFRRDLRLADNEALVAAARAGSVTPLFVIDPKFFERSGAPRLVFLLRNLQELNKSMGGVLVVRTGNPVDVVCAVAQEVGATEVFAAKDFAPYGQARDAQVDAALRKVGAELRSVGSAYAVDPGIVRKADNTPYAVFTPFSKIWLSNGWSAPLSQPQVVWHGAPAVASDDLPAEPACGATLPAAGENAAWKVWESFRDAALNGYAEKRNNPDINGTSQLSPYLRFGLVHPRSLLAELGDSKSHLVFRSELCWREFYADVLFHQPRTVWENLQPKMNKMTHDTGADAVARFDVWCKGETGFPIVDAGMKQMLATGWMHNRVRMIVASFLVKDLHLPWQWGAKFFMRHLVDGDIASNNHGWQWTAGTGTDASPYFRIFNPISQGERFDPQGTYVRQWIPELRELADDAVHSPWTLGLLNPYIPPMVDHAEERLISLDRYKAVSGK
ncbi:MAG: deoxyribodipyrimidine photo-lyase [Actinobacteria bacterium]|nr:deoxyribodipyrimidine photo-lyase [Actinomycetota bacterium]MSW49052.1 deoxyribodipyrimidine photo-lyase [Actinomycetota bacterium]